MRLTPPQAVALAHWTPGVAACRPWYTGGPGRPSVYALEQRALLVEADSSIWGRLRPRPLLLTPAGCSVLAHLIATEAIVIPAGCMRLHHDARGNECGPGCYLRVRGEWDMSRITRGATPPQAITALAWAPTAEEWARLCPLAKAADRRAARMGRAERDATGGGAAMAARR